MKTIGILMFVILAILIIFTGSSEDTQEIQPNTMEAPKKTYLDTPTNTYKRQVEALSISNTLQNPVNTYLDSRVDSVGNSRKSVTEGNKRMEEQNKAMDDFLK
jgi:hypothetical protein